jgi:hypothetical protein
MSNVTEEMVERALDAFLGCNGPMYGQSMTAAVTAAFASVEQIEAARIAWDQVYDVEIHGDGTRTDNRNAAMKAALLAALAEREG